MWGFYERFLLFGKKTRHVLKTLNTTCVDLILTNKSSSFQHTSIIETGLSDYHRLKITVMKINFQKQAPTILYYRNYNRFNNELFWIDLIQELSTQGFHNVQCNDFEDILHNTTFFTTLRKRTAHAFANQSFYNLHGEQTVRNLLFV